MNPCSNFKLLVTWGIKDFLRRNLPKMLQCGMNQADVQVCGFCWGGGFGRGETGLV